MYIDKYGGYYKASMGGEHYLKYYKIADDIRLLMRTSPVDEETKTNLNIVDLPNFEVISCPSIMSFKGRLLNMHKLKKIMETQVRDADFLVIKAPGFFANIAATYAKTYNKPYLVELGACPWDALWNHSLKGKIIAPYQYLKTKKLLKDATHSVYVTNEFLQKRYPTNGVKVNCSNVMLDEFNDDCLSKRISKIKGNTDKIVIGTTAAVNVKYKGQQYIIKALAELKKQGLTSYEYQMVGGGDSHYLRSIARKHNVEEQVKFLGSLPHNKVFEWLDTIDLYVQPSRQEGLPRALIEAMSRALPAFGARTAGIPELLESEFIFSNTRKNIDEICDVLQSFDQDIMLQQANRNYQESQKYQKKVIETRRKQFFEKFKNGM